MYPEYGEYAMKIQNIQNMPCTNTIHTPCVSRIYRICQENPELPVCSIAGYLKGQWLLAMPEYTK